MTSPLRTLTITAFRGSSQTLKLEFDPSRSLSLIYGENGTGKTTICDAFEFLAAEKVGSLEERGLGGSLHRFWHAAGRLAGDMKVELETKAGTCSGKVTGAKVSISPSHMRPRVQVLRRQQVLKLVEAAPSKRYDEIKQFIEIDGFEKSEQSLRDLTVQLGKEKVAAESSLVQSLESLNSFRDSAGGSAGDILAWARAELGKPGDDRKPQVAQIDRLRRAVQGLQVVPARLEAAIAKAADADTKLILARQIHSAATAAASDSAEETIAVLEAGLGFLRKTPAPTVCPMCESDENVAELATRLDARLQGLRGLQSTGRELSRCEAAFDAAIEARTGLEDDYRDLVERYREAFLAADAVLSVRPSSSPPDDATDLTIWLEGVKSCEEAWAAQEARWREEGQLFAALRKEVESCDQNRIRLDELDALKPLAEQALDFCVKQRQAFTSRVIADIAEEVGRLYEEVHPHEGLEKISLPLDPKKRASIDLRASFGAEEAPPQAYFSQSHLDTLGLCVFLALALRERPSDTILILDDVLGSVDEPHVERVIQMIYAVSRRFQHTILTTHYRPWREKYRWGWLSTGQCQFIELTAWRLADGMRLTTSKPEVARLKSLLVEDDPDPQAICSKAGVILEAILDHLTLKYGCAVPRRPGETYTLGDLLPAVEKKLKAALRVEVRDCSIEPPVITRDIALAPILDELHRIAQARNAFGAHFKEVAMHFPDADGIAFGREVERLADALIDPEHGWPGNDKSGSYWRNSGDTRRLHPLRRPQ